MNRSTDNNGRSRPAAKPASGAVGDDESALFRQSVGPIQPVAASRKRAPEHRLPSTRPRMREADEAAVIAELLDDAPFDPDIETGDDLVYRRPGVQHAVIRRLRRGHYRCDGEIDLHGMIVEVARRCLGEFLQDALDRGHRCVRIVHGKGLRSGHRGPVLKTKVAGWLSRRNDVLAYASARAVDGGTGALYVLLRRRTNPANARS